MRYVILGTAGHIDHGKSTLVKALTGIDPDRLKEEKERGITIDLGFADLNYPDGLTVGIVDVPGHERLVRNMLAGAGGIDIVLLVIAADEGIMPQSREHLAICDLLKIKSGLIAITKADLVEKDWLDLVTEEVRDFVKGTFLENSDIIPVSAKSGYNLDLLKERIHHIALTIKTKPVNEIFRLPIDRVFTLKGFGTVVTGTLISGSITIDDDVEILPAGLKSKVRGLHSHGKPIKTAYAGQRVAINLQGIEKEALSRGDVVVTPDVLRPTSVIDAKLELLQGQQPLRTRSLVHFHLTTFETIGRIILYEREELKGGESCYCQFRLSEPVIALSGDRFIIRRFSPVVTIGGGTVLDPAPPRRRKTEGISDLVTYEKADLIEKISMKIKKAGIRGMVGDSLKGWIKAEVSAIEEAIKNLKKAGEVIEIERLLFHRDVYESLSNDIRMVLQDYHKSNPLSPGMQKEELRNQIRVTPEIWNSLLSLIKGVRIEKNIVMLEGFRTSSSDSGASLRILKILDEAGFQPPSKEELSAIIQIKEKETGDILRLMEKEGKVARINDSLYLTVQHYNRMLSLLREFFSKKPQMTVAEFRDILKTTRKYAIPFLEHLDSNKITLRVGEVRKFLLK
ncbi:MAG: selenocysteine-specific translation elongation factor [Thermodesulfovibrionales bacterium]